VEFTNNNKKKKTKKESEKEKILATCYPASMAQLSKFTLSADF